MKTYDLKLRVYYEDTDAAGMVYHARYLAFAERAQGLPGARRNELADLASPLTGCSGEASTRQLYALANGLLGRQ